jgi:hypothetical protein
VKCSPTCLGPVLATLAVLLTRPTNANIVSRGTIIVVVGRGPFVVSRGPVTVRCWPFIVSRSLFLVSRGPIFISPSPFIIGPGPLIVRCSPFIRSFVVGPCPFIVSPCSFIVSPRSFVVSPRTFVVGPGPFVVDPSPFVISAAILVLAVTSIGPLSLVVIIFLLGGLFLSLVDSSMAGGARLGREGRQEAGSGRAGTSWWGNRGATRLEDKLSPKQERYVSKDGGETFYLPS